METMVRAVRLLAMTVWVGGIVFFAFVLAPTVFSPAIVERMHGVALSGAIVGTALGKLNAMGLGCGAIFVAATVVLFRRARMAVRGRYEAQILLAVLMLAGTAYLRWNVIPAMERDRAMAGGDMEAAARDSYARLDFDRLHARSEHVEGFVLLCGLAVVFLMARESVGIETDAAEALDAA